MKRGQGVGIDVLDLSTIGGTCDSQGDVIRTEVSRIRSGQRKQQVSRICRRNVCSTPHYIVIHARSELGDSVDVHDLTADTNRQRLRARTERYAIYSIIVLENVSGTRGKTNKRL